MLSPSPPLAAVEEDEDDEMGSLIVRDLPRIPSSPPQLERPAPSPSRQGVSTAGALVRPVSVEELAPMVSKSIKDRNESSKTAGSSTKRTREKLETQEGKDRAKSKVKKKRTEGDEIDDIFG